MANQRQSNVIQMEVLWQPDDSPKEIQKKSDRSPLETRQKSNGSQMAMLERTRWARHSCTKQSVHNCFSAQALANGMDTVVTPESTHAHVGKISVKYRRGQNYESDDECYGHPMMNPIGILRCVLQ